MNPLRKRRSKIGLALGSGAARGLAHIGVLKALRERGISVDIIAGSSMGALVGACYARKKEIAGFEEVVLKTDWKQLARLADPNLALLFKGVIHGKKVKELLKALIGDVDFKDLEIPLAVVAADVNTGEEIVIKEGSVVEAVRASISIPAIFTPVKFSFRDKDGLGEKKRFLIDGGIVNPVPVDIAKKMGAAFIIASNIIHKPKKRKSPDRTKKRKLSVPISLAQKMSVISSKNPALTALNSKINQLIRENKDKIQGFRGVSEIFKKMTAKGSQRIDPATPNIFDTIVQAIYTMEYELVKLRIKEADVVINPATGRIGSLEFYKGQEAILEGYKAVMKEKQLNSFDTKAG